MTAKPLSSGIRKLDWVDYVIFGVLGMAFFIAIGLLLWRGVR
jgi:hypothetical protein